MALHLRLLRTTTKLLKFGTRYYTPQLWRWIRRDPNNGVVSRPVTFNAYLCANADAVNRTDRTAGGTSAKQRMRSAESSAGPLVFPWAGRQVPLRAPAMPPRGNVLNSSSSVLGADCT